MLRYVRILACYLDTIEVEQNISQLNH